MRSLLSSDLPPIRLLNSPSGLIVEYEGKRIALDPVRRFRADYVFISHAHSDHLPPSIGDATVIASEETVMLAKEKGLKISSHTDSLKNAELIETGHILGSRALYLDRSLLYTGDLAGRARAFMPQPTKVSCETLIIESTYGRPVYRFPPLASVLKEANRLISSFAEKGKAVAVQGYPLGKSQILTYLFQSWSPLYAYGSVAKYNSIYSSLGIDLPGDARAIESVEELSMLADRGGVIVLPSAGVKKAVKEMMQKMHMPILRFTGWAITSPKHQNSRFMLPISDHADYSELISYVQACKPEEVITWHGFAEDLAYSIKRLGINARTLGQRQLSLTEYLE